MSLDGWEPQVWEEANFQVDRKLLCDLFGEVNVRRTSEDMEVRLSFRVMPQGGKEAGWQTGIALDASASMLSCYGRELVPADPRGVPDWLIAQYRAKGWIKAQEEDGHNHTHWSEEAGRDAVERRYLKRSRNILNPLAQRITAKLAGDLDADGRTTIIYWACGDGGACEVFGDFTAEQCRVLDFTGPKSVRFGTRTYLLPALKYFCDRFEDAPRGIFIFITDGRLDDMPGVVAFTRQLAAKIESGERKPLKCVLLGFGDDVDERQLRTLDDLNTGTGVDVWDHKVARWMDSLAEVFSEVVCERQIVAPSGKFYDDSGRVVAEFPNGLPAQVSFRLRLGSEAFELAMPGLGRTRQVLFRRRS